MNTTLPPSRVLFAAATIALGVTGIVNGDFALVWQNVPTSLPGRTPLAYVCAIFEIAIGVGLLSRRTLGPSCRAAFAYFVLWLVLLKIPLVVEAPLDATSWGGIGEIGIMTAGAWCLFAGHAGTPKTQLLKFAVGSRGIRAARWLLVVTLPMIAAEVIVDALPLNDKIMQPWLQWLPSPAAWAVLTGVASTATSLALLFGVWPRLAATMEAAMLALITVAYWAPDLYTGRTATTAFIISFLIAAGAWLVADTYRGTPWLATGQPVWRLPTRHDPDE